MRKFLLIVALIAFSSPAFAVTKNEMLSSFQEVHFQNNMRDKLVSVIQNDDYQPNKAWEDLDDSNLSVAINKAITYQKEAKGADVWQSATETFQKGRGDCEDFAILKARELQARGRKNLFILVVHNSKKNTYHAVLIAERPSDWSMAVWDNNNPSKKPYRYSKMPEKYESAILISVDTFKIYTPKWWMQ